MFYQYLVALVAFALNANANVNVKPFNNFSWFDHVDKLPGRCYGSLHSTLSEKLLNQSEGRWYEVDSSFKSEDIDSISCAYMDVFFDKFGNFREFYHLHENGEPKAIVGRGRQIRQNIFMMNYGKNLQLVYMTVLYSDKEMFARYLGRCSKSGNKGFLAFFYRDLKYVEGKKELVDRIKKKVYFQMNKQEETKVSHENCEYEPILENPIFK